MKIQLTFLLLVLLFLVANGACATSLKFQGSFSDPQFVLKNLKSRLKEVKFANSFEKNMLIESYVNSNDAYLYDQALIVMALTHGGDLEAASEILRALSNLQNPDGSWNFDYHINSIEKSVHSGRHVYTVAGSIAWVAMAINAFSAKFSNTQYFPMLTRTLDYLISQRLDINLKGLKFAPVKFSGADLPTTPWNETRVISLEHNLDAYSAFLHSPPSLSLSSKYLRAAQDIENFIGAMWEGSSFYAGFDADQGVPNISEHYLDTQSWGTLALESGYKPASELTTGLSHNCDRFFMTLDRGKNIPMALGFVETSEMLRGPAQIQNLWSEGSFGMVLALNAAGIKQCHGYSVSELQASLETLVDADGGVPYSIGQTQSQFSKASSVAGTAWLYFVKVGFNPFRPFFN